MDKETGFSHSGGGYMLRGRFDLERWLAPLSDYDTFTEMIRRDELVKPWTYSVYTQ